MRQIKFPLGDVCKLSKQELISLVRTLLSHFKCKVIKVIDEHYWAGWWYKHVSFKVEEEPNEYQKEKEEPTQVGTEEEEESK